MFKTVFKRVRQEYVLFCDTEFSSMQLVQVSFLLFKRDTGDVYNLIGSYNDYSNETEIDNYFCRATNINRSFLKRFGVARSGILDNINEFLSEIDLNKTLFVSHGNKNDRKVLKDFGVSLPEHGYCTYKNARKLLNRDSGLSLADISKEAGMFLDKAHDAYHDAWATVIAFGYLINMKR